MARAYVALLLLFCLTTPVHAPAPPPDPAVKRLLSQEGAEMQEAKNELLAARGQLIADLAGIIRDHENQRMRPASVKAAIFILGEMRAPEAAEVLATHIAFPQLIPSDGRRTLVTSGSALRMSWPAAEALIKIGTPCVPAVLDKLASTDHPGEGEACLAVLDALRKRDSVSQALEKAIAQQTDKAKRARLEAGLTLLSEGKVTPLSELGLELFRTPRWPARAPAP